MKTSLAALVALLAACVGRAPAESDGAVVDGGTTPPDGGELVDGGTPPDAGALPDDAGTPDDAGNPVVQAPPVFVGSWGGFGTEPGQFVEPSSVDLDENGVVIVAGHENRIQRFTMDGAPLEIWGEAGGGDGQFNHPHGLAVDDDRDLIYVGDQENHRLQVFTLAGVFVRQWGDAQFEHIHDIGIDRVTGDVFAGDYELDTVRKFSATGELLATFGGSGDGDGEFSGVWGIDTDSERNVYVADTFNLRVQKLDVDGTFLNAWSDFDGAAFVKPTGIFVDVDDVIHVCDSLAQMIYRFDTSGAAIDSWSLAEIYGDVSEPEDIVISPDGTHIFIGEVAGHRVLHLMRE